MNFLSALPEPPAWMKEGNCVGASNVMFPDLDDFRAVEEARQVCASCPVRVECVVYAMKTKESYGVWGGLTEQERDDIAHNKLNKLDPERGINHAIYQSDKYSNQRLGNG